MNAKAFLQDAGFLIKESIYEDMEYAIASPGRLSVPFAATTGTTPGDALCRLFHTPSVQT